MQKLIHWKEDQIVAVCSFFFCFLLFLFLSFLAQCDICWQPPLSFFFQFINPSRRAPNKDFTGCGCAFLSPRKLPLIKIYSIKNSTCFAFQRSNHTSLYFHSKRLLLKEFIAWFQNLPQSSMSWLYLKKKNPNQTKTKQHVVALGVGGPKICCQVGFI